MSLTLNDSSSNYEESSCFFLFPFAPQEELVYYWTLECW
jgi:hypothetical protein